MRYAIDLRSDRRPGPVHGDHDHYDPMPSHLVDKLREAKGRSTLSDLSPADAVAAARSFARRLSEALAVAPPRTRTRRRPSARSHRRSPACSTTRRDSSAARRRSAPRPTPSRASRRPRTSRRRDRELRTRRLARADRGGTTPAIDILRAASRRPARSCAGRAPSRSPPTSAKNLRRRCRSGALSAVVRFESPTRRRRGGSDEVHAVDLQRSRRRTAMGNARA